MFIVFKHCSVHNVGLVFYCVKYFVLHFVWMKNTIQMMSKLLINRFNYIYLPLYYVCIYYTCSDLQANAPSVSQKSILKHLGKPFNNS